MNYEHTVPMNTLTAGLSMKQISNHTLFKLARAVHILIDDTLLLKHNCHVACNLSNKDYFEMGLFRD